MSAHDATAKAPGYPSVAIRRPRVGVAGALPKVRVVARRAAAAGLVAAMVVGSVAMWTAIPVGGLWLASRLTDDYAQVGAGPYLVAALGIPAAMVVWAMALARLERVYRRVTGTEATAPAPPAWRRSISDSRSGAPPSVLDKVMVASVLASVITLALWFFLFAHAPGMPS
jgi:hypothetical protein